LQPANQAAGAQPFKNVLIEALNQVNTMQSQANAAVEQLITGGDVNPAEVLTSLQKADMSFRMMLQIRNKLVQAYQELNNIRI
jgi:flagellar hook-basal body complex protein FliE